MNGLTWQDVAFIGGVACICGGLGYQWPWLGVVSLGVMLVGAGVVGHFTGRSKRP